MQDRQINKILIIRLSSLGDLLLSTPVIRTLKQKYHNAQIDFIVKKQYLSVLQFNPNISNIFVYDKVTVEQLNDDLRITNYDLIIDLQNNFRSRRLTNGLNGNIYRFKKPTLKKLLLVWFKINLLKDDKTIPQRYAEASEIQLDDKGLELFIPKHVKLQLSGGKKYIGFCPGSKHFTKRWLPEYFIELGNLLIKTGYTIVIFGGSDDQKICFQISSQIQNSINLCNENDLLQTAADIKQCMLIVSNDSGLMHAAAAVGIPILAIFGSSVKEFGFTPYRVKNLILENNLLTCRPCSHIGKASCPKKHFRCIIDMTPGFVFKHVQEFLKDL